jgi:hypothetical protein
MKKSNNRVASAFVALQILIALSLAIWSCKYPNDPAKGNSSPETRLSNVPPNDTIAQYIEQNVFPELTVSWVGDDPDGYVIAFKYKWTTFVNNQQFSVSQPTTILNLTRSGWENIVAVKGTPASIFKIYNFLATLNAATDEALIGLIGDSLNTKRPFAVPYKTGAVATDSIVGLDRLVQQTPTTGTFIFDSPINRNLHRFEVSSIDNNNGIDATPAVVNFWTLQSPGSVCLIDQVPGAGSLVIRYATEIFPGLRFAFRSLDPNNTNDIRFSWAVDDSTRWTDWSPDGFAYVTASMFNSVTSGTHRFFVRAQNRWGVISPIAATNFTVVVPKFEEDGYVPRILVINGTPHSNLAVSTAGVDTNAMRAFYSQVLDSIGKAGKYDFYTIATTRTFPPDSILGRYSLVIYGIESSLPGPLQGGGNFIFSTSPRQQSMRNYLRVGGKFIFIGVPNVGVAVSSWADFSYEVLHILRPPQFPFLQNNSRDFAGSKGRSGYPSVPLDASKIPAAADSGATLRLISLNAPYSFAETIGLFDSQVNNPLFEDMPLGVRFLAPVPVPPAKATYSTVYFGFPLYFGQRTAVIQTMRKALSDCNE